MLKLSMPFNVYDKANVVVIILSEVWHGMNFGMPTMLTIMYEPEIRL